MISFLRGVIGTAPAEQLPERLRYTAYDELILIRPEEDTYRSWYHSDGKFFTPVLSNAFHQLVEYAASHMIHPEDREAYLRLMDRETLARRLGEAKPEGILEGEARFLGLDGNWHRMQQLMISGEQYGLEKGTVALYFYDIREMQERDQGLPTESATAIERIRKMMPDLLSETSFLPLCDGLLRREKKQWCMIAVDIKHFKLFREVNGPEKAEKLLIRFGEVLAGEAEKQQGYACYRGQDDFGLFMPFERSRIENLFSRLRTEIDQLTSTSGFVPILGICTVGDTEIDAMEMFNRAALTAEEIKDDLQYHIRVYDPALHEQRVEEFRLLTEFTEALEKHEITFYLQPQVNVNSGKIVGAEALARWPREDGTFSSPAQFVPVLEKYGVITELDLRIWEEACAWLRKMMDEGVRPVPVSVNVSRINIFSVNVPELITGLVEKYGLEPRMLKVEITESAYVDDSARVQETITELRSRGFQVMMDDFGSGYSSLNMLRSISVDVIKLDAQFLRFSLGDEQKGINILESVINMTKSLSIPIVVEGVETHELAEFLKDMGCHYIQGFYFFHPMSVGQFEELLRNPDRVDYRGIFPHHNQQMEIREFLENSIYSDTMLNNILGPVIFYRRTGDSVDIIRFNQQFLDMTGLEEDTLEARRHQIEQFLFPEDRGKFLQILDRAEKDRMNGAGGLIRVYKPSGAIFWMQLRVYYLEEQDGASVYYGSGRDMTELQYINQDLPGGYYRAQLTDDYEFLYVSENLLRMLGYTREELRDRFDNKLARMIHPDDLERVRKEADLIRAGKSSDTSPYRILHGDGSYRYMLDQSRLTDLFGEVCWQSVVMDVTELMTLRNRMRLLEEYSTDCVAFLHDIHRTDTVELACYGLEEAFGVDRETFRRLLAGRELTFTDAEGRELYGLLLQQQDRISECNGLYTVRLPDGRERRCHLRFNSLKEEEQRKGCIISIMLATGQ